MLLNYLLMLIPILHPWLTHIIDPPIDFSLDADVRKFIEGTQCIAYARRGEVDLLKRILESGNVSPSIKGNHGMGILHYLAMHREIKGTLSGLELQADMVQKDAYGDTPLIIAAKSKNYDMLQFLLEASPYLSVVLDSEGRSVFDLCCSDNKKGGLCNHVLSTTCISYARQGNTKKVIKMLSDETTPASPSAIDDRGEGIFSQASPLRE